MSTFAAGTDVDVSKTRGDIERTLMRYGATSFAFATEPGRAVILFESQGMRVRFDLPLPARDERRFTHHSRGERTAAAALSEWEQGCRQRWRALLLCIKAKLESVESGIETYEEAFLPHFVLPDGRKMGDVAVPAMRQAYSDQGALPPMFPARQIGPGNAKRST